MYELPMELLVMMVFFALEMISVLLECAKDLEDVFVEMVMFLLLLKIVNLLELDVVIQLAILSKLEPLVEQVLEFVTHWKHVLEHLQLALLMLNLLQLLFVVPQLIPMEIVIQPNIALVLLEHVLLM
jgi:hypothetical protein